MPACNDQKALQGHCLPGVPGGALVKASCVPVDYFLSIFLACKALTARCMLQGRLGKSSQAIALGSHLASLALDSLQLVARLLQEELESALLFPPLPPCADPLGQALVTRFC